MFFPSRNVFFISGQEIAIHDTYRLDIDSSTIFKRFGSWTNDHDLVIKEPSIWTRRGSLNGFHLRWAFEFAIYGKYT